MKRILNICAVAALAFSAAPALAHHNANAQYDNSKVDRVTGTLTEIRDISPHAQWKLVSVDPQTKQQITWSFESVSNANLRRLGIEVKKDLRIGNTITIIYTPARDGSKTGFLTGVVIGGKEFIVAKL